MNGVGFVEVAILLVILARSILLDVLDCRINKEMSGGSKKYVY